MICKIHQKPIERSKLEPIIEELPDRQVGTWGGQRNKCVYCAYLQGRQDVLNELSNSYIAFDAQGKVYHVRD